MSHMADMRKFTHAKITDFAIYVRTYPGKSETNELY